MAAFLVHMCTITRYVGCRVEHLVTIRRIGLDSITVSTHLLQQTIYWLLCYVTQRPFSLFSPPVRFARSLFVQMTPDCTFLTRDNKASTLRALGQADCVELFLLRVLLQKQNTLKKLKAEEMKQCVIEEKTKTA